jgi:hypothetical protein
VVSDGTTIVEDPRGRTIILAPERWAHIVEGHPELRPYRNDVIDAVAKPDALLPGRIEGEEWFYARDAGPSRWLKVVVVFDPEGAGRIITAFPRRRKP